MPVDPRRVDDLAASLGVQVRRVRLAENITQDDLAARADISVGALRNLESGRGASVTTLLRALRALGRSEWIDTLEPEPQLSPLAIARAAEGRKEPQRATRRRPR